MKEVREEERMATDEPFKSEDCASKDEESVELSSPAENMCVGEIVAGTEAKRSVQGALPSEVVQDPRTYGQQVMCERAGVKRRHSVMEEDDGNIGSWHQQMLDVTRAKYEEMMQTIKERKRNQPSLHRTVCLRKLLVQLQTDIHHSYMAFSSQDNYWDLKEEDSHPAKPEGDRAAGTVPMSDHYPHTPANLPIHCQNPTVFGPYQNCSPLNTTSSQYENTSQYQNAANYQYHTVSSHYQDATVSSQYQNTTVNSTYQNTTVNSGYQNASTSSPYQNTTISSPYQNTTVSSPYQSAAVSSPYQTTTVSSGIPCPSASCQSLDDSQLDKMSVTDSLSNTGPTNSIPTTEQLSVNDCSPSHVSANSSPTTDQLTVSYSPVVSTNSVPRTEQMYVDYSSSADVSTNSSLSPQMSVTTSSGFDSLVSSGLAPMWEESDNSMMTPPITNWISNDQLDYVMQILATAS